MFTAMNVCIFYNLYAEKEIVVNKFLYLSKNRNNTENEVKYFYFEYLLKLSYRRMCLRWRYIYTYIDHTIIFRDASICRQFLRLYLSAGSIAVLHLIVNFKRPFQEPNTAEKII